MTLALAPDLPSLATFGAPKQNFDNVVDADTEESAEEFNAKAAQLVMLSMTAWKAWATVDEDGTLIAHGAMWGNTGGVAPTTLRTGAGRYTVTWASSHNDMQAVPESRTLTIQRVKPTIQTTTHLDIRASKSGTVVTVHIDTPAGVATDAVFLIEIG